MRNKLMKITLAALSLCLALSLCSACAKGGDFSVTLGATEIERFEQTIATVAGAGDAEIEFSSSDEAVATVDKDGTVTATGEGTATITAKIGKKKQSAELKVTPSNSFPTLAVSNESVTLRSGNEYDLTAALAYRGNEIPTAFEVNSSDEAVANTDGLKITAAASGECTVTVTARYAGVTLSCDVNVKVVANESFTLESPATDVLYLSDPENNGEYITEFALVPLAYVRGEKAPDPQVSFTAIPAGIVEITDGVVRGIGEGSAIVAAKWTGEYGEHTATAEFTVRKPIIKTNKSVDFRYGETVTLDLKNIDYIAGENCELYCGETRLGSSGNGVFTFDSGLAQAGETALTVRSDKFVYELPVVLYTHLIASKADWIEYTKNGFKGGATATTAAEDLRDGYIILAADIDMGGDTFALNRYDSTKYQNANPIEAAKDRFYGVFDGRGHTIYNLKIGRQGFFGCIGEPSVIKNAAFANVTIAPEINWFIGVLAHFTYGTVDNCYVELDYIPDIPGVGTIARYNYGTISNSVTFVKRPDNTANAATHGAICQSVNLGGAIVNSYAVVPGGNMKTNTIGAGGSGSVYDSFEALSADADLGGFDFGLWKKGNFTLTFDTRYDLATKAAKACAESFGSPVYEGVALTANTDDFIYETYGAGKNYLGFANNAMAVSGMPDGGRATVGVTVSPAIDVSVGFRSAEFTVAKPKRLTAAEIDLHRAGSEITLNNDEIAGTVTAVYLDGETAVSASGGNGSVTIAKSGIEFALGDRSLIISTDEAIYLLPVRVATMFVYSASDLGVYKSTYFRGGVNARPNADALRDGYVLLKADIDMQNALFGLNPDAYDTKTDAGAEANAHIWRFYGVFDGEGHVIDNVQIDYYGFFGHLAADSVVRNLGITGVTFRAGHNRGAIAEDSHGLIENCFVEVKEFPAGNNFGCIVKNLKGTMRNCVAYFSGTDETANKNTHGVLAFTISGKGKLENCYAVTRDGGLKAVPNTSKEVPVYASPAELLRADGFVKPDYFIITDTELGFGSKIYNFS